MKPTGQPVIRLYVDGGKSGKRTLERQLKEIARTILVACGVTRYKDHHTFHPTFATCRHAKVRLGAAIIARAASNFKRDGWGQRWKPIGVKWFADLHPLLWLCTGSSGHKFNVVTIQRHRRFEAVEDYADCVLVAATSNDDAFIIGEARASSVLILNRTGAARRA